MIQRAINIKMFLHYLFHVFEGDDELVKYFDKDCPVEDWRDCCRGIDEKIRTNYPNATIKLVTDSHKPIGYYVIEGDLLISFGLHMDYRTKEHLMHFWGWINSEFLGSFSCVLYSHNTRAIGWLQKSGMKILFDNVTILTLCQQED